MPYTYIRQTDEEIKEAENYILRIPNTTSSSTDYFSQAKFNLYEHFLSPPVAIKNTNKYSPNILTPQPLLKQTEILGKASQDKKKMHMHISI